MRKTCASIFARAFAIVATLMIGSQACAADPASVAAEIRSPEETVAFLLFGAGYKDPCKEAYDNKSCPLKIASREVHLNDGTYENTYKLAEDYCGVEQQVAALATGEMSSGKINLRRVRAISVAYSRYLGRSVEFAFIFSGQSVENSDGQTRDQFRYYHEYYAFSGRDFGKYAQSELDVMQTVLKEHQQRYCDRPS